LKKQVILFSLISIVFLFTSCENTIDPIDKETGAFAIYGVLNLDKTVNYIRVRDLKEPFTANATREIDAVVTFENLDLNRSEILEGNTVEYDGVFEHNFEYQGTVSPDTQYRITVERSDGATTQVTARTPTQPAPEITPQYKNCYTNIKVSFEPMNGSTIVYRIGAPVGITWWGPRNVLSSGQTASDVSINFIPVEQLLFLLPGSRGEVRCHDMTGKNFFISIDHYGPGLYDKIRNDPFDILQSTERFGAFYRDTLAIPIDTSRVCPQDC
jgi:hypothetical protein